MKWTRQEQLATPPSSVPPATSRPKRQISSPPSWDETSAALENLSLHDYNPPWQDSRRAFGEGRQRVMDGRQRGGLRRSVSRTGSAATTRTSTSRVRFGDDIDTYSTKYGSTSEDDDEKTLDPRDEDDDDGRKYLDLDTRVSTPDSALLISPPASPEYQSPRRPWAPPTGRSGTEGTSSELSPSQQSYNDKSFHNRIPRGGSSDKKIFHDMNSRNRDSHGRSSDIMSLRDRSSYDRSSYDRTAHNRVPHDRISRDNSSYDTSSYDAASHDGDSDNTNLHDMSFYDSSLHDVNSWDASSQNHSARASDSQDRTSSSRTSDAQSDSTRRPPGSYLSDSDGDSDETLQRRKPTKIKTPRKQKFWARPTPTATRQFLPPSDFDPSPINIVMDGIGHMSVAMRMDNAGRWRIARRKSQKSFVAEDML